MTARLGIAALSLGLSVALIGILTAASSVAAQDAQTRLVMQELLLSVW